VRGFAVANGRGEQQFRFYSRIVSGLRCMMARREA